MKAEIISIGTEILLGEIVDTNAAYLAGQLPQIGLDLYWVTQVGDNRSRLIEVLNRAWERSDIIITTGGLGPTEDDLTRETIAEMLGEEMRIDPDLEIWLRDLFKRLRYEMPERNLKQAMLIPSASAVPNPRGSAPGWFVERDDKMILAMPGPPGEMQYMWENEIKARLQETFGAAIIRSRTLKILGLGEATVDEMISPLLASDNPSIGVYAKSTGIELRLTAKAARKSDAQQMLVPLEKQIRAIIGDYVWGVDEDTLEQVAGNLLCQKGLSLATMESCTGGLLASLITDVPGSSGYFKGGLITYCNEMKVACGVDPALIAAHGVVSHQVAEAMALAVRDRLGADIGIGTTGVAGPAEIEGKPAGTVYIGIADGETIRSRHISFPQHRQRIKEFSSISALYELRRLLMDKKP